MKLNLGAGRTLIDGYENWDRKTGQEIYPLQVESGTIDEIRASHVLEHFPRREVQPVVDDWARALKPGGWLKIAVPDFAWIAEHYIAGDRKFTQAFTMGGQMDEDDFHYAIFDECTLTELLNRAGLVDIQRWKSEVADCASYDVSLNLMGRK